MNDRRPKDRSPTSATGLYVSYDGWYITLRAPREHGDRNVALEPPVMEAFLKFAESAGMMVRVGRQRPRDRGGGRISRRLK